MGSRVAICSQSEYQSHLRCREAALASGGDKVLNGGGTASSPFVGVRERRPLCLRKLLPQDGVNLRSIEDGVEPPNHLPLGLHLLVPSDWGLQPSLSSTSPDSASESSHDIIFLGKCHLYSIVVMYYFLEFGVNVDI